MSNESEDIFNVALNSIKRWHEVFNVYMKKEPSVKILKGIAELRKKLLIEEGILEYERAVQSGDFELLLDSLADTLVIVFGTATTHGISSELLSDAYLEVMKSNFSKLDEDGKPVPHPTVMGKIGKSHLYREPDIKSIIEKHGIKNENKESYEKRTGFTVIKNNGEEREIGELFFVLDVKNNIEHRKALAYLASITKDELLFEALSRVELLKDYLK